MADAPMKTLITSIMLDLIIVLVLSTWYNPYNDNAANMLSKEGLFENRTNDIDTLKPIDNSLIQGSTNSGYSNFESAINIGRFVLIFFATLLGSLVAVPIGILTLNSAYTIANIGNFAVLIILFVNNTMLIRAFLDIVRNR